MGIQKLNRYISSFQLIILGFFLVILLGSFLLMLPIATNDLKGASFLDALFTATSAACVTGLVLHNTAQYWSFFGQAVILLLIQIGGMGVVTVAIAIAMLSGRKISLMQRSTLQEAISAHRVGGIVKLTAFILKTTFLIELLGAVSLYFSFGMEFGWLKGIWYSVFHSISAFCNAGFDLMGEIQGKTSLMYFSANPFVNVSIMLLIIIGGIGFLTWEDIRKNRFQWRKYRMQSKVVLLTTAVLITLPTLYFFFIEFGQEKWQDMSLLERLLASLFQSVTPRTAGFNTIDLSEVSEPGQLITIFLMLIGGSSGSTAGGFKVTTLAVLAMTMTAVFRKRDTAECFGRRLSSESVHNAVAIFAIYMLLFLTGGILICGIEGIPLLTALFEAASAIATVGLSLGITAQLGAISQIILIGLMFFGRVGCLTLVYAVISKKGSHHSHFPEEKINVG